MRPETETGQRVAREWHEKRWDYPDPYADVVAIEQEAVKRERPTQEEIEAVVMDIATSGYSSDAVSAFERWTRERWGIESDFSKEARAEANKLCACGHKEHEHGAMSESGPHTDNEWVRHRWCNVCDDCGAKPSYGLATA